MSRATKEMRSTRAMNWHRGKDEPLHVYMCPECELYHVGHVTEETAFRNRVRVAAFRR